MRHAIRFADIPGLHPCPLSAEDDTISPTLWCRGKSQCVPPFNIQCPTMIYGSTIMVAPLPYHESKPQRDHLNPPTGRVTAGSGTLFHACQITARQSRCTEAKNLLARKATGPSQLEMAERSLSQCPKAQPLSTSGTRACGAATGSSSEPLKLSFID